MLVVIMAGGVGERFWPSSRRLHPKQLLDLTGRGSMLRLTIDRIGDLAQPDEIYVYTNREQRDAVLADVRGLLPEANVIGEPEGRNTAPTIGLAAMVAEKRGGAGAMLVLPADHVVEPASRFRELVRAGEKFATAHRSLLTFGIVPTRPETGYGYIRPGPELWHDGSAVVLRAEKFLEKPAPDRARELVAAGCFWNSGMFLWRTDTLLEGLRQYQPDLFAVLERIGAASGTRPLDEVLNEEYRRAPAISIDYGLMEKADNVAVMRADFSWNDVGSWEFIRDVYAADAAGNVLVGEHIAIDATGNTVVSGERLVGLIGVEDIVVVDAGDAILVCRRDRAQDVRKIVAELKRRGRNDLV
ncbi:MAG TPA: mannose-1-phosphate guanylyltransferase [Candidatus Krumholzibacteria bacterium]|nr:mannose-1-phosphate guanylyltransferase [Candidatus Krumholzibacteria bacterium]